MGSMFNALLIVQPMLPMGIVRESEPVLQAVPVVRSEGS